MAYQGVTRPDIALNVGRGDAMTCGALTETIGHYHPHCFIHAPFPAIWWHNYGNILTGAAQRPDFFGARGLG